MSGFNALMNPAAIGQGITNSVYQGQEMARQGATQQAMAAYAQNPNQQNALMVASHDSMMGIKLQDRETQRAAAQQEQATSQLQTIAKLARSVKDEGSYQRALQLARQMGIDTAGAPPNYDPAWVEQQAQTYEFFAGHEGEALSGAGKQAMDLGFEPGTVEFMDAVRAILEAGFARPYTGAQGETRLYTPKIGTGGQLAGGQSTIPPEAVEALRAGQGTPEQFDEIFGAGAAAQALGMGGTPAPQLNANGLPQMLTPEQYEATVRAKGKAATDDWMRRNNIQVGGR